MIRSEAVVGLPGYEVTGIDELDGMVRIQARFSGCPQCPSCNGLHLRLKDTRVRRVRHESWGSRRCQLWLESHKWRCKGCGKTFWQRFPGILPRRRASEPFRRSVSERHWDGISRSRLARREKIGSATIERWFHDYLAHKGSQVKSASCPQVLGIDEHFFSRRLGYATTLCDLRRNKVFDVVLGRSEKSLESYLGHLKGKEGVKVVCMDLSVTYRAIVKRHFPNARIVADRFHVIRLVNQQFLAAWRLIDPLGSRNRGLICLMRRHPCNLRSEQAGRLETYFQVHPAIGEIYRFKQQLCELLLIRGQNQRSCYDLVVRFLGLVRKLLDCKLAPLVTLGETLKSWAEEIVTMWRFSKNNGITEGFHNKMEALSRQAYGFRNFENYRLRVRVMCA